MSDAAHTHNQLTTDRRELKFCVPLDRARAIAQTVGQHLTPHRFAGRGSNQLPGARHFVTTVYFDTAEHDLYREARTGAASVKVRAKEYYDQHVALTEVVRDRRELFRSSPSLWIELKQTTGTRSGKRRVGIPKRELAHFFATGAITEEMLALQRTEYGDDERIALDALVDICRRYRTPLRPSVLVNYRRSSWEGLGGTVRLTIDRDLAFFAPQDSLWDEDAELERARLGAPVGRMADCIVEVKCLAGIPAWLDALLSEHAGPPVEFSKFTAASAAAQNAGR